MPELFNQYFATIRPPVLRFAESSASSSVPAHRELDPRKSSTIDGCLDRLKRRASYLDRPGICAYYLGINSAAIVQKCLTVACSDDFERILHNFDIVQDACGVLYWAALDAHLRNEEHAKRSRVLFRLRRDYFQMHLICDLYRNLFLIFVAVIVCERWGLDRYEVSMRNDNTYGCGPRHTPQEFREVYYVRLLLREQLTQARRCYLSVHVLYRDAHATWERWRTRFISTTGHWDEAFDDAVVLRQYQRTLQSKLEKMKADVDALRLSAEVNAMGQGRELSRLMG
ncbi:hypothetical protein ACLMJK_005800 [Lecanora helva]